MKPLVEPHIEALVPYSPGKPISEVQRELGLRDVVKLASNENPLGPSPRAFAAVRAALDELHLYPDGGAYHLKRALSERFGWPAEGIALGNGSNEVIELLVRTFVAPGMNVVTSAGSFIVYKLATLAHGREIREAPLGQDLGYDLDALAALVDADTRIVFIANPNNPTGSYLGHEALARFIADLDRRFPDDPPLVALDEAYVEYVDAPDAVDSLALARARPRTALLRTFSKAYGLAGLRCGFALTSPELVGYLNRVRAPFNVNSLAQVAALAALEDEDHVTRGVAMNREEMARLAPELSRRGLGVAPSQANFLLVDFRRDGREVFQALLQRGVVARPMGPYGLPTSLRITVGKPEENARLLDALDAVLGPEAA